MYVADFSKTNLTKFAVISEKKSPKGRFLKFEKLQNHRNEQTTTTTTTSFFGQKYKSWIVCPVNSWKASSGGALTNTSTEKESRHEGKGKEKEKERGEGKEEKIEKKAMAAILVFIMATFWPKKTVGSTEKARLAITGLKKWLDRNQKPCMKSLWHPG